MLCLLVSSSKSNTQGEQERQAAVFRSVAVAASTMHVGFSLSAGEHASLRTRSKFMFGIGRLLLIHLSITTRCHVSISTRLLSRFFPLFFSLLLGAHRACCHSLSLHCCCWCVLERLLVTCLQYQSHVALRKASRICWSLLHRRQPSSCRFIPRSHIPSWTSLCEALHRSFPRLPPQRENRDCWRG